MNKLRTLWASLLLASSCSMAVADDYQYLTVTQTDTETSYAVSNIQKITFDATDMVLVLSDGTTQRLPLSGLQKMFFAAGPTGISAVTQSERKFTINNGRLQAAMAQGEQLTIYNIKGEAVFTTAERDAQFDLSALAKGVYIVKVGTETRKVVNK